MILIGSRAYDILRGGTYNHRCNQKEYPDIDIIATYAELDLIKDMFRSLTPYKGGTKFIGRLKYTYTPQKEEIPKWSEPGGYKLIFEIEIADGGNHTQTLYDLIVNDKKSKLHKCASLYNLEFVIPSLNVLYMIKMSHRYLKNNTHFQKTMRDIYDMRRSPGTNIEAKYYPAYLARQEATYNYEHPKLSVDKETFFNSSTVPYKYDHDQVHKLMAIYGEPAYTFFKKDGAEVAVDRDKWEALPDAFKLASVIEEAMVLALERSEIPFAGQSKRMSPSRAFEYALTKVCTSISSGWWREYAWENFYRAWQSYPKDFVDKFWEAVNLGEISEI